MEATEEGEIHSSGFKTNSEKVSTALSSYHHEHFYSFAVLKELAIT
jgi:hypothetical protein